MISDKYIFEKECKWETIGDGIRRQVLGYDDQMMMVKVEFQAGSVASLHAHPHRQCTYVAKGEFKFKVDGETRIVKAGDGLYLQPDIPHGVVCLKEGILIDTFSPIRKDFLSE